MDANEGIVLIQGIVNLDSKLWVQIGQTCNAIKNKQLVIKMKDLSYHVKKRIIASFHHVGMRNHDLKWLCNFNTEGEFFIFGDHMTKGYASDVYLLWQLDLSAPLSPSILSRAYNIYDDTPCYGGVSKTEFKTWVFLKPGAIFLHDP
jgi:hypothetical protein